MISQEEYWYLWQFFTATAAEVRSMSVLLEKGVQTPSESHSSAPMVNLEGLLSLTLPHMIHSSGSIEPAQDTGHSKIPSQCFPFGGGGEGLYLCSVLCLLSCLLACFVGSLHSPWLCWNLLCRQSWTHRDLPTSDFIFQRSLSQGGKMLSDKCPKAGGS